MDKSKSRRLREGETFITSVHSNNMRPLLECDQNHRLIPTQWKETQVNDIVYCAVSGKSFTGIVKDIHPVHGCLVSDMRNVASGRTKYVYGRMPRDNERITICTACFKGHMVETETNSKCTYCDGKTQGT